MTKNKFGINLSLKKADNATEKDWFVQGYASVEMVDRDGEVILLDALKNAMDEYMTNPILKYMHSDPIGTVKSYSFDDKGLIIKARISRRSKVGQEVWGLIEDNVLSSFSIGGMYDKVNYVNDVVTVEALKLYEVSIVDIPANPGARFSISKVFNIDKEKLTSIGKVTALKDNYSKAKSLIDTTFELVNNEFAIQTEVNKFASQLDKVVKYFQDIVSELIDIKNSVTMLENDNASDSVLDDIQISDDEKSVKEDTKIEAPDETKAAISYTKYPLADENTSWDGNAARKNIAKWASSDGSGDLDKIDYAKYKKAFAWYDSENSEQVGSYKFPHHDIIDGDLKTVWKGVAAAMASLAGARNKPDIPENEIALVYSHLSQHYKDFDKEPPALKSLQETEDIMDEKKEEVVEEVKDLETKAPAPETDAAPPAAEPASEDDKVLAAIDEIKTAIASLSDTLKNFIDSQKSEPKEETPAPEVETPKAAEVEVEKAVEEALKKDGEIKPEVVSNPVKEEKKVSMNDYLTTLLRSVRH